MIQMFTLFTSALILISCNRTPEFDSELQEERMDEIMKIKDFETPGINTQDPETLKEEQREEARQPITPPLEEKSE